MPALLQAVAEHADGYVRYRALVLLTGFNDPRTKDAMRESLDEPERSAARRRVQLLRAQPRSRAGCRVCWRRSTRSRREFVRPALVRALAALRRAIDARVQQALVREVGRGEDFFRSAVIEALGDYKAAYAFDAIAAIAKLDGPLQDDAALALGQDRRQARARDAGRAAADARRAQRSRRSPRRSACSASTASRTRAISIETLKFADSNPGFQELLRGAAAGPGALARRRPRRGALEALFDVGIPSRRSDARAGGAGGRHGRAAEHAADADDAREARRTATRRIELLAEGFDMLEEDLDKERFFAFVAAHLLGRRPKGRRRAR